MSNETNPATYEPMPAERPHPCYEVNSAGIPIAWVNYDPRYGWLLEGTNAYGDGHIGDIDYCPYCGEKLEDSVSHPDRGIRRLPSSAPSALTESS